MRNAGRAFVLLALVAAFWFEGFLAHTTPEPTTALSRDLHAYFFSRYVHGVGALWRGEVPLWNPWELCGVPFLASAQTGTLNPIAVVLFGLLPAGAALQAFFLVHYVLAGALVFGLGRTLGLGAPAASLAALAWTFSPALTRAVYHPNRLAGLVWLPLVFLLGARLARHGRPATAAWLAVVLALQCCAGYPEFALDTGLLLGLAMLLGLGRHGPAAGSPSRVRALGLLMVAAVVGVLLAGVQLGPMLELFGASAREATTARPVLAPGPEVLGTLFGLRPAVGHVYLGMVPALYVGAVPLALVVVALPLAPRRLMLPFLGGALACVAALVGYELLHRLPVYRATRFALPWALLFPFFPAVLAGIGWEALVTRGHGRGRTATAGGLVLAVAGAGTLLGWWPGLVFAPVTALVVLAAMRWPRPAPALAGLLALVLLADAWMHLPYRRGTDPLPPVPPSATTRALLAALRAEDVPVRFLGAAESSTGVPLREQVASIAGLEDSLMPQRLGRLVDHLGIRVGVSDMPLRLRRLPAAKPLLDLMGVGWVTGPARWAEALAQAGFVVVRPPSGETHGLWRNPSVLPRAFLVRRTRTVEDANEAFAHVVGAGFRPRAEVVLVDHPPGLPPPGPVAPGETARIVQDAPEELVVRTRAAAAALLVVSDTYFPGWTATVDGRPVPILEADYAFRAMPVPAGAHVVRLVYRPRGFRVGVAASLIGLVLAIALGLTPRRR